MITLLRTAALTVVLVALLTWLMVRSFGPNDAADAVAEHALDAIALNESMLQGDVLSARAGLLRNYDPLVRDVEGLRAAAFELVALGSDGADRVQAIRARVLDQEDLVERFKSDNALLQNSLAYFNLLSDRAAQDGADPHLAAAIGSLVVAVTRLAGDPNPDVARSVLDRLTAAAAEPVTAESAGDMENLLLRGRLLLDLLPRVDILLRRLPTLSTASARQGIAAAIASHRIAQEQHAAHFRLALYAAALLLVGLLVIVGLQLRAGALALQRRATLEHLVGLSSNRFLACQPEEIAARLDDVLETFGEGTGADRVYVLRLDKPHRIHLWNRPGAARPAHWPEALFDVASVIEGCALDPIRLPDSETTVPPILRATLDAAGIRYWSCAKLMRTDRLVGLLCFDRYTARPAWLKETLGLLRMEGDVIGNALHREYMFHERTALEARLQRGQRLEAIGTFTSGVAHNFNNVIGSVLGYAELAAGALPPESEARRHVGQIAQAGERAREIVGQILDFGRRGYATRHVASLDALLAETVSQLQPVMPPSIELLAEGTADGALVMGEPAQLQQVLVNLIRNAAEASEPGSSVKLRLDRLRLRSGRVLSHGSLAAGDYIRITATDSGRGMEPAILTRIFDPFFTTRSAGTGLGLATAREVVAESGGAFDVRSAPARGSTFEVWLPEVAPPHPEPSPTGPSATIMLVGVDRDDIMRDEELLAALGYEPVGFADPQAALAALRTAPDRFDLIIVDGTLQGMTGMEFARSAGTAAERHPVIMSTSSSERVDPQQLYLAGISDIVRRPWRSGALTAALRRNLKAQSSAVAASA